MKWKEAPFKEVAKVAVLSPGDKRPLKNWKFFKQEYQHARKGQPKEDETRVPHHVIVK